MIWVYFIVYHTMDLDALIHNLDNQVVILESKLGIISEVEQAKIQGQDGN